MTNVVVVGGSGFLGTAVAAQCVLLGYPHASFDRAPPAAEAGVGVGEHDVVDLLRDEIVLPPGDVVLVAGNSMPRVRHPWTLAMDNVLTTARLLPQLSGRRVVLGSSIETFGRSARHGNAGGLPLGDDALRDWSSRATALARQPCPPERAAALCEELVDPGGRWTYGLAKRAQELMLIDAIDPGDLRILRLANLFGPGQDRVISRLTRRAMAGLPLEIADTTRLFIPVEAAARNLTVERAPGEHLLLGAPVALRRVADLVREVVGLPVEVSVRAVETDDVDLDALIEHRAASADDVAATEAQIRRFVVDVVDGRQERRAPAPTIPVVTPPRCDRPDLVAARQQESLWSGRVKGGNRWTTALTSALRDVLELDADKAILLCASGSAALRLAVVAEVGMARPGDVAVLPSFTFAATAEVLIQLGYRLQFVDVDAETWTIDPAAVARVLETSVPRVVVAVDALGAPADYRRLTALCERADVALIADSAPALGALHAGRPVGSQVVAHAFSMSFAKVVSAAGAGGALILPAAHVERLVRPVDWLRSAQFTELPAIVALEQVERLEDLVRHRTEVAAVYDEFARSRPDVLPQQVRPGDRHALVHWVARFPGVDRHDLQQRLGGLGVESKPYYAPALHRVEWPGGLGETASLPVTDALVRDTLALPMSSELTGEDAERVVSALDRSLAGVRRRRGAFPSRPARHARRGHVPGAAAPASPTAAAG